MSRTSRFLTPNTALYGTIGACTSVSLYQFSLEQRLRATMTSRPQAGAAETQRGLVRQLQFMRDNFTWSQRNLAEGRVWTWLTGALNHGGGGHLAVNMLALWSFGQSVAGSLGPRAFLRLFWGGALLGNAATLMLERASYGSARAVQRDHLGASGGCFAVSTALAVLAPKAEMFIFPIPFPIKMWMGTIGFVAYSIFAQTAGLQGRVDHMGHLGGAAFGAYYAFALITRRR